MYGLSSRNKYSKVFILRTIFLNLHALPISPQHTTLPGNWILRSARLVFSCCGNWRCSRLDRWNRGWNYFKFTKVGVEMNKSFPYRLSNYVASTPQFMCSTCLIGPLRGSEENPPPVFDNSTCIHRTVQPRKEVIWYGKVTFPFIAWYCI